MEATFDFHPEAGNVQHVTAYGLTAADVTDIRKAIADNPDAVVRVSCSVTPGAESRQVRVFRAGMVRNFTTR